MKHIRSIIGEIQGLTPDQHERFKVLRRRLERLVRKYEKEGGDINDMPFNFKQ